MQKKVKFILSDLHLGVGVNNPNNSNLTTAQALVNFLEAIHAESDSKQQAIELFLNGNFFDFLQVPAVDEYQPQQNYPLEAYTDSSEVACLKRLEIIATHYPKVFTALSDFMHPEFPKRRITIIKGDHDVHLFWPGIKNRLRYMLKASGERASLLLFAGEFINRENVYIEHGHQRAEKVNRYPDFIDPRRQDDPQQLYYPPSSQLLINLLHDVDLKPWFIGSVKPATSLIWYALSWDFNLAIRMLANFRNYLAPDLADEFWYELENGNARYQISQRYTHEPKFRQQLHYRLLHYLNLTMPPETTEATKNILNLLPSNPLTVGQAEQQQQHNLLRDAATEIIAQNRAKVVIFGHTHHPSQETITPGHVYINTGGWTKDFSHADPETIQAWLLGDPIEENSTNRFPYVRIDFDGDDNPIIAQLLYWSEPVDQLPEPPEPPKTKRSREDSTSWLSNLFSIMS